MNTTPSPVAPEREGSRIQWVLVGLLGAFTVLAVLFVIDAWGRPAALREIPAVDKKFLDTAPFRASYANLVAAKEDLSDFDCYACHEKNKPPPIKYDANHKIIIPKEHANIELAHGSHDRNNNCYNCHNEANLLTLHARDGRDLKFSESTSLCGSCHGPTYRDWDAGAHGRTSGHWHAKSGPALKLECVNCHNPHAPRIPGKEPAPGPHPLRDPDARPLHGPTPQPTH